MENQIEREEKRLARAEKQLARFLPGGKFEGKPIKFKKEAEEEVEYFRGRLEKVKAGEDVGGVKWAPMSGEIRHRKSLKKDTEIHFRHN